MLYIFRVKKSVPVCSHASTEPALVGGLFLQEVVSFWNKTRAMDDGAAGNSIDALAGHMCRLRVVRDKACLTVSYAHRNGPAYNWSVLMVGVPLLLPEAAVAPVMAWYQSLQRRLAVHSQCLVVQTQILELVAKLAGLKAGCVDLALTQPLRISAPSGCAAALPAVSADTGTGAGRDTRQGCRL
jgi:hypothetical protein